METVIKILLTNIAISMFIFFCIATTLIIIDGKSKKEEPSEADISFDVLDIDYSDIPSKKTYKCRDGSEQIYRYYPSKSENILVLLHGSGWHSQYFLPLAEYISSENLAHVYTPDLRGHGENPERRGDIDYINQYEDDIADLLGEIQQNHPNSKIILGGHSSGGALTIRFAGSKYREMVDAFLMLTPYLKYNAPTMRKDSGGWVSMHKPRVVGLSMLNNMGIKWFNHLPVIDFNMPEKYRDGTETLTYSHRLNTGFAPTNYKKDLMKMHQKALVVVGESDESFVAENFRPEMSKYKPDIEVKLIKSETHMGLVVSNNVKHVIKEWILNLDE